MQASYLIFQVARVYGAVGCAVAAAFLLFGIDRIDPSARGSYAFRTLIAPGAVLLWPLVLVRWLALARQRA
jgi:hypothetical protein